MFCVTKLQEFMIDLFSLTKTEPENDINLHPIWVTNLYELCIFLGHFCNQKKKKSIPFNSTIMCMRHKNTRAETTRCKNFMIENKPETMNFFSIAEFYLWKRELLFIKLFLKLRSESGVGLRWLLGKKMKIKSLQARVVKHRFELVDTNTLFEYWICQMQLFMS